MLKTEIDDIWHIEACRKHSQFRDYEVYAVMGNARQGLLGCVESVEEVMTIMLNVAMGTRTITDYVVEKKHFLRSLLPTI